MQICRSARWTKSIASVTMRRVGKLTAFLTVALVLAACSSDGDDGASSVEQTSLETPTAGHQCSWRSGAAGHDGAGQHSASVFSLTNVSAGPCAIPALAGVRAVGDDGRLLADGIPGSFFPVESLGVESIGAGERSDFVLTTTSQESCGKTAQVLSTTVRITLKDGDPLSVTFPWTLNVACGLQFSEATRWSD